MTYEKRKRAIELLIILLLSGVNMVPGGHQ
jgi:hypothetical protein